MLCTLLLADNLPVSTQGEAVPGIMMNISKRAFWRNIPNEHCLCPVHMWLGHDRDAVAQRDMRMAPSESHAKSMRSSVQPFSIAHTRDY